MTMISEYTDFLTSKRHVAPTVGVTVARDRLHPALFPFQRDLVCWALAKGRAALFADCVAGDTILQGPDGNERFDVLAERGEPLRVWSLNGRGEVVAAWATAPFLKGIAPLYRFTMASGQSITVTAGHRLLTPTGWTYAGNLSRGDTLAVCAPDLRQTSSDIGLSGWPSDGRCSVGTLAGSTGHYAAGPHRCDRRLHSAAGNGRELPPSQADVLALVDCSLPTDDLAHRSSRIHRHQGSGHPSTPGYVHLGKSVADGAGYPLPSFDRRWSASSSRNVSPTLPHAIPAPSECGVHPSEDRPFEAVQCEPFGVSFDTVVCIHYTRTAEYYDLHVPLFENYLANDIWSHNTGLGKTLMQLEWARHAGDRTLILAPLAVAQQTVAEGAKWGYTVTYARKGDDAPARGGIVITNYEMMTHFDPDHYGAVVLDESSILKAFEGKTRSALIERFRRVPMRLCCTATPAPNDITEIANHSEFLGVMPRVEMLAAFFVHDDAGWRLKGHARAPFYRWLASWGMSVRKPSDLGYADDGYDLPPLAMLPHFIDVETPPSDRLFAVDLKGVGDRARVRRDTLEQRVAAAVEIIKASWETQIAHTTKSITTPTAPREQWIIWCGLNAEQDALARAFGDDCISVYGSLPPEEKLRREKLWRDGHAPILISKAACFSFGMNWQHCSKMVFVGLSDSYEQYYQCIRRCYRFGQKRPVTAHIVLTEREQAIYANVLRKEREAAELAAELIANIAAFEREELHSSRREARAATREMALPAWIGR